MKFYIAVDCEGPACVVGEPGKGLGSGENYRFACLQATREANAAARALFDAGAQEVVVWDAHGTGVNLQYDLLDPRCASCWAAGTEAALQAWTKAIPPCCSSAIMRGKTPPEPCWPTPSVPPRSNIISWTEKKRASLPSTRHTRASWAFRCCSARATTPVWPRPVRCFPASPPL